MSTSGIRQGDLVRVDVRGRRFYAEVTGVDDDGVHFRPLVPGAGYRTATARQIIGHWRATTATRRAVGLEAVA